MALSTGDCSSVQSSVKRVVIIDDRPEEAGPLKSALEYEGYQVNYFQDANVGLAVIETDPPDLLVLDLLMPKRSGFLVLEHMLGLERVPYPVMMTTGVDGERHRQLAEKLGVCAYLQKPYSIEQALDIAEDLIQQFRRRNMTTPK